MLRLQTNGKKIARLLFIFELWGLVATIKVYLSHIGKFQESIEDIPPKFLEGKFFGAFFFHDIHSFNSFISRLFSSFESVPLT